MHEPNHKQGGQCLRVGSLFSGYGGLDLAVEDVFDADTIWFSEINQPVAHHWPGAPNLGDITTIDWPSVPPVDILCGGFPCQDVSTVGKMAGLAPGTRSGLWAHMATAIDHLQPEYVVIENVRGLLSAPAIRPAPEGDDDDRRNPDPANGLATSADAAPGDVESNPWHLGDEPARPLRAAGAVLGDLVDLGYDAQWIGLPASAIGAPHPRFRVFILAHRTVPHPARLRRRAGWGEFAASQGTARDDRTVASDHRPCIARAEWLPAVGGVGQPVESDRAALRRWGRYADAITRWEHLTGRPAPAPALLSDGAGPRPAPAFVEWLMGLVQGWVTDPRHGLSIAQQLAALGNGVLPRHAEAALRVLLRQIVDQSAPGTR